MDAISPNNWKMSKSNGILIQMQEENLRTSKSNWSLTRSIAFSMFFFPTKHHAQTVSETTSIWISFFEVVTRTEFAMSLDYLQIHLKILKTNKLTYPYSKIQHFSTNYFMKKRKNQKSQVPPPFPKRKHCQDMKKKKRRRLQRSHPNWERVWSCFPLMCNEPKPAAFIYILWEKDILAGNFGICCLCLSLTMFMRSTTPNQYIFK